MQVVLPQKGPTWKHNRTGLLQVVGGLRVSLQTYDEMVGEVARGG